MKKFQLFPKRLGISPYIYLAFFIMPLSYLADENGMKAVIGYFCLTVFAVAYRQSYATGSMKNYSYWIALQIAIVIFLTFFYNPNLIFMGFFPASFIGSYSDKKHFQRAFLSFLTVFLFTAMWIAFHYELINVFFFLPYFLAMLAIPIGIRSMTKQLELKTELSKANEQIRELIKKEERVRIARDLHDTLGHTLSLITLQSQLVQRLADKQPEKVKAEAKEIEVTSRSALREVRELVSDMQAVLIEEELVSLEQLVQTAGIDFHLTRNGDLPALTLLQQNVLGMCLREVGTNIVKHSKAKSCDVNVLNNRGKLEISVRDDGVGFVETSNDGSGLQGMKERLALIDGQLDLKDTNGVLVKMLIPILSEQQERVAL